MEPLTAEPHRETILNCALDLTLGDRAVAYGDPTSNMVRLAALIAAYLGGKPPGYQITPVDAAAFNVLIKLSRIAVNPLHYDSWVDMAAYAGIGGEVAINTVSKEI